ncbi:C-type lectin domain family 5 member A-like [Catharus ustulatus]|uniref:C-type lectin domain family 5 member A-like n=1 Tax=Catharus ustulatus TaxID=91951 RepID=UPI0014082820|nr:C-type lectin domain family 5 member A-like [Catharus ustulatus]
MAENVHYADLNCPEPTRPRIQTVPDVQDTACTYAEVKVKCQDTNAAAKCKSSGKSCCSRKRVAVCVVIILVLVLAVYLIITYAPTAGSQNSSISTSPTSHGEAQGCPPPWKKHGRKCYFFSPEQKKKDWNSSHAECAAMNSDLVIIESEEELNYLLTQSRYKYYLLGLRYSPEEQKWKWINNVEHDPAMFPIHRYYSNYDCVTIGFGDIGAVPCSGTRTIQNMCEKPVTI